MTDRELDEYMGKVNAVVQPYLAHLHDAHYLDPPKVVPLETQSDWQRLIDAATGWESMKQCAYCEREIERFARRLTV